ncbi:MAG: pyrimidine-nucleoside phosphorylase, partial [Anaerolineae bacterium]|nr:pyrimidine-nucleoside phosphorylase [Anaerolineae bacterium]
LQGRGPADFRQHCVDVAAEMLLLASTDAPTPADVAAAKARAAATLDDGRAWAQFRRWIAAQGGDCTAVDEPDRLPRAPLIAPLRAPVSGYVAAIDAREVGYTVVDLGGGRAKKGDPIDPAVGVVLEPTGKIGGKVTAGEPLLWVHARTAAAQEAALARLSRAYRFSETPVAPPPVVHRVIR